ncbi:NAD-dependent epimerase/dehydratase family protein [Verrucomicrobium sp. BvORR034]|uniref:NAD-dependent epimerase/dehydratase family protein n=1 Tax=Verrucomicrobium sp. BvORR034 TaxID=1396418 RepID=UPI000678A0FE|nr:NAD-dependent epimerase/dehydratase family protein [Verrucomicrobium sp. BvORR034]
MKTEFALFGATGSIGASIAATLREAGVRYRVVGRDAKSLQKTYGADPLAEIRTWNPDDPASVVAAAEGVDTLITMVGVPYDQFHLHPQIMRQTLAGAIEAGVKRVVLIGTLYPFGRPQTDRVNEFHPREPHTYKGRMRKEQEDILMEAGRSGQIQTTILRLPDFYGPRVERSYLDGVFKAIASGGRAQMLGPIDRPHEFVFVPDVGPVVMKLARNPWAYGRTWNLGGAGVITQREFAEKAFALAGRGKVKLMVAGRLMLRLMGLFNPVMRELVEMHYLLTGPLMVDDTALQELLGGYDKTSYEEGIAACLKA